MDMQDRVIDIDGGCGKAVRWVPAQLAAQRLAGGPAFDADGRTRGNAPAGGEKDPVDGLSFLARKRERYDWGTENFPTRRSRRSTVSSRLRTGTNSRTECAL